MFAAIALHVPVRPGGPDAGFDAIQGVVAQPDVQSVANRVHGDVPDGRSSVHEDVAVAEYDPRSAPRRPQELVVSVGLTEPVRRKFVEELRERSSVLAAEFDGAAERHERAELAVGGVLDEAGDADRSIGRHERPPKRALERTHFVQTVGRVFILGVDAIRDRRVARVDFADQDRHVLGEEYALLLPAPWPFECLVVAHAQLDAMFLHAKSSIMFRRASRITGGNKPSETRPG